MDLKKNVLDAIGNTPLVKLGRISTGVRGELYAKCEFLNPGGSIKDRIGLHMIDIAEKNGTLKPGGTIVEATSGNTGMGLAIAAAIKGYKTVFVMPDKMSEEKRQNLRAFGARVVITPTGVAAESPYSHYSTAARIARETPNSLFMNQYSNLANRETHYQWTGPEIFRQTDNGNFDAIVIGMGTCGTISGIGKYIKEHKPSIKVIGVDPKGSILKDLFETGKMPVAATYKIEGIGEDIVPGNCDFSVVDEIIRVEDKESYLMTRALLTKEGIFAGSSSGAAVTGALRWMATQDKPGRVLVIMPDSGNRYLSKVYNDAWMIENGFMDKKIETTIGSLVRILNKSAKIEYAAATDHVDAVVKRMRDLGVSQIPVKKGEDFVGLIQETALLRPLLAGEIKPSDPISKLVDENYSVVQDSDSIERLNDIFLSGKVALVSDGIRPKYILTKIDLIGFLSLQAGV